MTSEPPDARAVATEGFVVKKTLGALMFGAAVLSLFAPARRAPAASAPSGTPPKPARRAQPRLHALVQTKPHVVVLAVSTDIAELERELAELNETVNHWDLRTERHAYDIQQVPLLVRTPAPAPARSLDERQV